jgi:hypothetical protein
MNTWVLDTAIARLLSTNAVVLTEPLNSQMVGNSVAMFLFPIGPSFTKRKISYQIALHVATRREPYFAGSCRMARIALPPAELAVAIVLQ